MQPSLLLLVGSASAGVFTLIGVAWGKRSERRTAHETWLRDRQLDAYDNFLQSVHLFVDTVSDRWRRMARPTDAHLNELRYRCGQLLDRITLLSPDEVSDTIQPLLDALTALQQFLHSHEVGQQASTDIQTTEAFRTMSARSNDFIRAASAELWRAAPRQVGEGHRDYWRRRRR